MVSCEWLPDGGGEREINKVRQVGREKLGEEKSPGNRGEEEEKEGDM